MASLANVQVRQAEIVLNRMQGTGLNWCAASKVVPLRGLVKTEIDDGCLYEAPTRTRPSYRRMPGLR